jgi:hypothetical protein
MKEAAFAPSFRGTGAGPVRYVIPLPNPIRPILQK